MGIDFVGATFYKDRTGMTRESETPGSITSKARKTIDLVL